MRMGTENNTGYISEVENGKRDFSVSMLARFANALGLDSADLLSKKLAKCDKLNDDSATLEPEAHFQEVTP